MQKLDFKFTANLRHCLKVVRAKSIHEELFSLCSRMNLFKSELIGEWINAIYYLNI